MITMYDSIGVGNLPGGAEAYAGYVGGEWPTWSALKARFPKAKLLSVAIAADEFAMCLDVESGNATNSQIFSWYKMVVGTYKCPVIYTSASNIAAVVATMTANGIKRNQYLIWSAHYTDQSHVCGSETCGYPQSDGTQWTDSAGACDESVLEAYFFTAITNPNPKPTVPLMEDDVQIPPATNPASSVGVSFDGTPYSTVGFLADPGMLDAASVVVRAAFHLVNAKNGADWDVQTVTLTVAEPKAVLSVPGNADGVSFSRADTVPLTLVPNFA